MVLQLPLAAMSRKSSTTLDDVDALSPEPFSKDGSRRSSVSDASTRDVPTSPSLLNDEYRVGATIGFGGYSTVRFAQSYETGEACALKSLWKGSDASRAAAWREANTMNLLNHKSINRLVDVIEEDAYVHLVVEYVEGQDLLEEVLERGPFEENRCAEVMRQLLDAIAHCHSQGIVHQM